MITVWILLHRKGEAQLGSGDFRACLQNILLGKHECVCTYTTHRGFVAIIIDSVKVINNPNIHLINIQKHHFNKIKSRFFFFFKTLKHLDIITTFFISFPVCINLPWLFKRSRSLEVHWVLLF